MKDNLTVAVLGGDERQQRLAGILSSLGYRTRIYKRDGGEAETEHTGTVLYTDVCSAVKDADVVVFPLPSQKNGIFLNEKSSSETKIAKILHHTSKNAYIFGGKMSPEFEKLLCERGFSYCDYYLSETFALKNAWLTAEGALGIFTEQKKISVRGAKILVTGSGRVAKCTAQVFKSLGADVTVMARNKTELLWFELSGYRTADLSDRGERLRAFAEKNDALINTVPAVFIDDCDKRVMPDDLLYIELASAPYGTDLADAELRGIKVIKAGGLPGKYAPESAALIIAEVITEKLKNGF